MEELDEAALLESEVVVLRDSAGMLDLELTLGIELRLLLRKLDLGLLRVLYCDLLELEEF